MKINRNSMGNRVFALIFLAYSASYIARKTYSACMSDICSELALSKSFAGYISTGYLACYGTGQVFSGLIGDRVSPRKMIFTGLFGAGLSNIMMGITASPAGLLLFWCLNGCFQSLLWSSVVKSIAFWIPEEKRSKAGTAISVSLPAGTALSYLASSFCLKFFNWKTAFIFSGCCAAAMSACWIFGTGRMVGFIDEMTEENRTKLRIQTAPQNDPEHGKKDYEPDKNIPEHDKNDPEPDKSLLYCIFSCGLLLAVPPVLCNGILKDGITEWIPSFLTERCAAPSPSAALLVTLLPLINIIGSYAAGWINEKHTHNEIKTAGLFFSVSTAAALALLIMNKSNAGASLMRTVLCVLLFSAVTCSMQGANSMFMTFVPLRFAKYGRTASVSGFLNACAYLAAALSGVISGSVLENHGWNSLLLFFFCVSAVAIPLCVIGSRQSKM